MVKYNKNKKSCAMCKNWGSLCENCTGGYKPNSK